MHRENGVFVLRSDARPSTKPPRSVTLGGPVNENEPEELGFRWQARRDPNGSWKVKEKRCDQDR